VDPNDVKCGVCEGNEAEVQCVDCPIFLCTGCKKGHLRVPATANHRFITIEEALTGGSEAETRVIRCQRHPHQEVNSYCKTDQTAVCSECVVDAHMGHGVDRLVSISEEFKGTISTLVNKVRFFSFLLLPLF